MQGACGEEKHIIAIETLGIHTTPRQNGSSVHYRCYPELAKAQLPATLENCSAERAYPRDNSDLRHSL